MLQWVPLPVFGRAYIHLISDSGRVDTVPVVQRTTSPHCAHCRFPIVVVIGLKRAVEGVSAGERTPEAKRARVPSVASQMSPKATPPAASPALHSRNVSDPFAVSGTQQPQQPQSQPPQQPQRPKPPQPVSVSQLPRMTSDQLQASKVRLLAVRDQLAPQISMMKALQAAGRHREAEEMKARLEPSVAHFQHFKAYLESHDVPQGQISSQQMPMAEGTKGSTTNLTGVPSQAPPSIPAPDEPCPHIDDDQPAFSNISQPPPRPPSQTISLPPQPTNSIQGTPGMRGPPIVRPEMAAQMQKLIERKGLSHLPHFQPPSMPPQQTTQQAPTQAPSAIAKSVVLWAGFDPQQGSRKFQTVVQFQALRAGDNWRPELWPPNVAVTAIKDRTTLTVEMVEQWASQHMATLLTMRAEHTGTDANVFAKLFEGLTRLLFQNKWYGYTVWPQAGGTGVEKRAFVYSKGDTLYAAYFPQGNGVPDLPMAAPVAPAAEASRTEMPQEICGIPISQLPPTLAAFLQKLPPQQLALLNSLPQDKRLAYVHRLGIQMQQQRLMAMKQQQQQQGQQQQQPQQQQQQHQQQQNQPQQQQHNQQQQASLQTMPQQGASGLHAAGLNTSVMNLLGSGQQGSSNVPFNPFGGGPQQPQQMHNIAGMNPNLMQGMQNMGISSGMHQRSASGGAPSAFPNAQMMQSFMQRNGMNGGSGAGMG